jgi:RNA polymerase sigma-70 factor (ECF subfamily)
MEAASEEMSRALYDRLHAFIARRVAPADVDDLVQEVLPRIHQRIDTLYQADRLDAWAYQITRNAIIDHYRARARLDDSLVHEADVSVATELANRSTDEVQEMEAGRELAACLIPLVDRLAEPYRQAVSLVELERVPQVDAAVRMGLSTSGTKSRVQRARQQRKALLLECCHVEIDRRGGVVDYDTRSGQCGTCGAATGQTCCAS